MIKKVEVQVNSIYWRLFYLLFIFMLIIISSCNQSEIDDPIKPTLVSLDSIQVDSIPLVCNVCISDKDLNIHPWYSHEDECCYFFIPSAAKLDNVYLKPQSYLLYINGMPINRKMSLTEIGVNKLEEDGFVATLSGNWQGVLTIKFLQSRNVSTLSINTESGSLDYIHKDKKNTEAVNVTLFNEDGKVDFTSSDFSTTLKGRGHGTWSMAKKPYLLKLSKSTSLLGMRKAKKWVLLANASDETNLRNWIALRLAEGSGLQGTPRGKYMDVYANGNYLGLYLMTEKVSPKLVKKNEEEPILVRIDNSVDADSFRTERGTIMEVDNPGDGAYSIEAVRKDMNQFEDLLFSGLWMENVDIDSWAKKYLVDEITENGDAGARSNYFYYFPGSLYVYGGPVWDYDLTLGRSRYQCGNPYTFVARREYIKPLDWTPHYYLLLKNNLFYKRVKELFVSDFIPIIESLSNSEIRDKYKEISCAIKMNAIRWDNIFAQVKKVHQPVVCTADELVDFLIERLYFLKSAWVEGRTYHLVQMTYFYSSNVTPYMCFSVENGFPLNSVISIDKPEFAGYHWVDKYTGEPYDPNEIVTRDREFVFN